MYKKLPSETVIETITNMENGKLFRICYESDVSLNAATKKLGTIKIKKIVEATVRTGVEYNNIERIVEKKENRPADAPVRNYTNNYKWLVPNKVKYNSNTEKTYIQVAPLVSGGNKKVKYIMINGDSETFIEPKDFEETVKEYVLPSYFKKSGEAPEVMTLNCENIIRIGDLGETI